MSAAFQTIKPRGSFSLVGSPLPRLHVSAKRADGRLYVHDRLTGAELAIYTPRFNSQFRQGHRAGRWYVRPADEVGVEPRSVDFGSAREAVEAVARGAWKFRVIYSDPIKPAARSPKLSSLRVFRDHSAF